MSVPHQQHLSQPQALYRERALAARYALIEQPLRLRASGLHRTAIALLLICVLGAGLLAQQPYSEKVTVSGFAEQGSGHVRVRSPAAAVVERIAVVEGQWVEPGDVLMQLGSDAVAVGGTSRGAGERAALAQEARALAERQALIGSRSELRKQALHKRRDALEQRSGLLLQTLEIAQQQASLAQDWAQQVAELARAGTVAPSEARLPLQQALASQRALLDTQRLYSDHELALQQIAAQQQEQAQLHGEALAQWAEQKARLQQRRAAQSVASHRLLTAAAAGSVSSIIARVGDRLRPNQPVLSLVAQSTEGARVSLLVPSEARGVIAKGQTVRLRYAGYPYQKYGMPLGRIMQVSRTPVRGSELEASLAANSLVYLAVVGVQHQSQDGDSAWSFDPLEVAPGMQLQADILVRSDPIWRRLLEPLSNLGQHV